MGFKLPQLGALFVANVEKGQLVDEKVFDEKGQRIVLLEHGAEYKALLKKYTELPHDGIALIVANAFMRAKHHDLYTRTSRRRRRSATSSTRATASWVPSSTCAPAEQHKSSTLHFRCKLYRI